MHCSQSTSFQDVVVSDHILNLKMTLKIIQNPANAKERRPLIFIAHCLGGIVLENALQVAADPYSNEKLIEYVHAYIKQLISIPPAFIDLKQGEVKFEVESFYADADATKLVGEDLARCPKTPPSRQLDRTQLRLSQYDSVDDKDLEDVLGILAKWLVKIAPPEENEEHREPSIVSNATFTESKNSGLQLGQNSGTLSSIRFTNETK
ncbi:hypothetical protein Trco_003223 [Trichoderma cornu-damae]|uniref:Fungal death-pathway protein SesB domain-containing protein n=1 Tax=Trichoderma cornu-damae TaxID=654480 RepID=A0A9P8TZB5_9HYPO|nr:hypothetical protein Trco_003223 [Trichoderma cornu-damae]